MDTASIVLTGLSLIIAAISLATVCCTLSQNRKIMEESSRPFISVYSRAVVIGKDQHHYIVIRNFGNSLAYITQFKTDIDFSGRYGINSNINFIESLNNSVLAPGQSHICHIDISKFDAPVHFSVVYKSNSKTYSEELDIDLRAGILLPIQSVPETADPDYYTSTLLQALLLRSL